MTADFNVLCLGDGPAGQRAAVQAAKLGTGKVAALNAANRLAR